MEGIGQFDSGSGSAVPRYDKHGRLLTDEQRKQIADRRGVCIGCGTQTHAKKSALRRKALTNDNIYEGVCIRCNQKRVPSHIFSAWDVRNKPVMSASVSTISPSASPGSARRVPALASQGRLPSQPLTGHSRGNSSGTVSSRGNSSGNVTNRLNNAYGSQRPTSSQFNHAPSVQGRNFPHLQDGSNSTINSSEQSVMSRTPSAHPHQGQHNRLQSHGHLPVQHSNPQHHRAESHGSLNRSGHQNHQTLGHGRSQSASLASESQSSMSVASVDSSTNPPLNDSQRSIMSSGSHHSDHSNEGSQGTQQTTPLEDEKAALGFHRTAPATKPGAQSYSYETPTTPTSGSMGDPLAEEQQKTSFESEKAALGIVRDKPATGPGVQSFSLSSGLGSVEPSSVQTTSKPVDEKANYRSSPASKPGVQSVSSRSLDSNGTDNSQSDENFRLSRSARNESEATDLRESMSPTMLRGQLKNVRLDSGSASISTTADLRLSLQDNYKGDEVKLSTDEYIKQLGENLDDPIKLRHVLHNLRNIEDKDQADVLHPIKEILSHMASDARVGDVAVGVVWRTAASSADAKIEVMQSGVIDILIDFLRKDGQDHDFCQWTLGLLTSISFNMENKEIVCEKGGIDVILSVLSRHKQHAGVLEWACRCLHNLVFCYEEEGIFVDQAVLVKNITTLEEAGGISIIIDAMSQNTTESNAQLWAIKLLWRMLGGDKVGDSKRRIGVMHRLAVIRKMVDGDFVLMASKLLRQLSSSGELQHLTAELMTAVLLGSGGDSNKIKLALLVEKASQCVPSMIRSMKQMPDDLEVQAAGCRMLSALCNASGEIPVFLIEQGSVDAIASAMMVLQDNVSIVEAGTWAMWKLSAEWKSSDIELPLDASTIRNVMGVLQKVTANHDNEEIQRCMNGFLTNVCGTRDLKDSDFPITQLVDGFFAFPKVGGGETLALLCSAYPHCTMTVVQSLDLARVVNILNDEKSDMIESLVPVLVECSRNSVEAKQLMISSGLLSAAVAVLESAQKKEDSLLLLNLIGVLSTKGGASDGDAPLMPRGFCQTIQGCLEKFGSDEESAISILQLAVTVIAKSSPTSEANPLLHWATEKLNNPSASVAIRVEACNVVWAIASQRQITDSGVLSDLFSKILSIMVQFNGDNGQDFNLDIQNAAAGTLGSLAACIRTTPIPIEPLQVDKFMGAVYKARPLAEKARDIMVRILLAIWHLCFVHEGVLLQSGVIILVIDIMGAYKQDVEVQEKCCMVLAQLASSENIQITLSIVETDGVQMLLEALGSFPSSKGVQSAASKALAHLSTDVETRMLVNAMGAVNLLLTAVTNFRNDMVLLERASSAVLNLTSDAPEQFLDFSAIVRAVVNVMAMHPNATTLRENGLGILQNVCMKGPAAKEIIAAEGGIKTVISAMEKFITTPTVLERSFSTLWSLAVLPANQARISEAKGIEMVVSGMYASIEYERVQQQGCGCMFTLALDTNNRLKFRKAGGVEAVALSSKAHFGSSAVQAEVCKCLAGLSTPGEGSFKIQHVSQDEIDSVVFAMERFQDVEGVQVHGCLALKNFLLALNAPMVVAENKDTMVEATERAVILFGSQCSPIVREFNQLIQGY